MNTKAGEGVGCCGIAALLVEPPSGRAQEVLERALEVVEVEVEADWADRSGQRGCGIAALLAVLLVRGAEAALVLDDKPLGCCIAALLGVAVGAALALGCCVERRAARPEPREPLLRC